MYEQKRIIPLLILLSLFLFLPSVVLGSIGVGVGTGKIVVDEILKPGLSYTLPPITVFNTGDEPSEYYLSIDYSPREEKLKPLLEWFSFSPDSFFLEPEESKVVRVAVNIPTRNVEPGEYFAFVTAQPRSEKDYAGASVGVAAATKLYFTVESANWFQALGYRIKTIYMMYHPWNTIVLSFLLLIFLLNYLRKRFKIVDIRKSNK